MEAYSVQYPLVSDGVTEQNHELIVRAESRFAAAEIIGRHIEDTLGKRGESIIEGFRIFCLEERPCLIFLVELDKRSAVPRVARRKMAVGFLTQDPKFRSRNPFVPTAVVNPPRFG
jgi:hypothetical protein